MTANCLRYVGAPERDVWAELVKSDPTALVFQTPDWLRCLSQCGWEDASRLYETAGGRILVLPAVVRRHRPTRASVLASLPSGWGTGGLVADGGATPDEAAAVASQLVSEDFLQIRLRPTFGASPSWQQAAQPSGRPVLRRVHVLDLRGGMEVVWKQRFKSQTRQGMRAARRRADEAEITVRCGQSPELVSEFYALYLTWVRNRARAHGVPTWLAESRAKLAEPRRHFEVVAREMDRRCRIRVASLHGRPVAATITLLGDRTAIYWRGYDDRDAARALHLPELLQLAAIEEACDQGCVDYEMGESGGVASLERFKLKLGATPKQITEYRYERLPISRLQDGTAAALQQLDSLARKGIRP